MRSAARSVAAADRWAALVGASFDSAGDDERDAPTAAAPDVRDLRDAQDALDVATDLAARAAVRLDRHPQFARWSGPRAVSAASPAAALDLVR
jgi:hypothetical protein